MKQIVYIHGFNSGPGKKVDDLIKNNYKVICPQLKNVDAKEDLNSLIDIIDELLFHNIDVEVIGTSLGGFYALCLSKYYDDYNIKFHCINPSLKPEETLTRFIGKEIINYKTSEKYKISDDFLISLRDLNPLTKINEYNKNQIYVYIGNQDNVLTYNNINAISNNIVYENQDHRFSDISTIIKNIK